MFLYMALSLSLPGFASYCHAGSEKAKAMLTGDAAQAAVGPETRHQRASAHPPRRSGQTRSAAASERGLTKRSSRPPRGCTLPQSGAAKSMTARPDVGSPSLSRSRASTSPEAINRRARSCSPGIVPDHQQRTHRRLDVLDECENGLAAGVVQALLVVDRRDRSQRRRRGVARFRACARTSTP